MKCMAIIISIAIFGIIGRLFTISILHHEDYSMRVENQLLQEVSVYYPRGQIVDRNEIAFTDEKKIRNDTENPGIINKNSLASHVMGKVKYNYKDNTIHGIEGVSGLEKVFNEELNGGLPIKIFQIKDGTGESISEDGLYVSGDHINQGNHINTTLDFHIQRIIEEEITLFLEDNTKNNNENTFSGIAVVVMDVKNGEVLGMASIGDENNKALHSFPLGSIFKTVVAAKALEEEVVKLDEEFICNGTMEISNQLKHCNKREGHGTMTFKEAFAISCNNVFYEVASRLTEYNPNGTIKGNQVLQLAKDFGFHPISEEKMDSFILADKYSKNTVPDSITGELDIFNMALGQGKIEANPLITTKIMSTIGNNGVVNQPTLVKKIVDQSGETVREFETSGKKRIISEKVNQQVQELLEEVIISGTARSINSSAYNSVAGKTGTAQNGRVYPHGWFAGYFPTNDPQYAMTVFVEEGGSGSSVAVPLFNSIQERILKLGLRN